MREIQHLRWIWHSRMWALAMNGHPWLPEHTWAAVETDTSKDGALVYDLEISIRASNCLLNSGITTVRRLRRTPDKELLRIPGLGIVTLNEIRSLIPFRLDDGEAPIVWDRMRGWIGIDDKPRIRVYAK